MMKTTMQKAILRFRFSDTFSIEGLASNDVVPYIVGFIKDNLKEARLLCAESFRAIDADAGFSKADAADGAFSFMEIICELDEGYINDCTVYRQDIADYLLHVLSVETVSLTDIRYDDDDKYLVITNHLPLPL
jgi:hypothetical protein